MSKTKLWPKPGVLVKDPRTRIPLPAKGGLVDLDGPNRTYWMRRLRDGDLLREAPADAPGTTRRSSRGGSSSGE